MRPADPGILLNLGVTSLQRREELSEVDMRTDDVIPILELL